MAAEQADQPGVTERHQPDSGTATIEPAADSTGDAATLAPPDKRHHERNEWKTYVRLTIEQHQGCNVGRTEANVQTRDLSRSGFSFTYRQYVPEGSIVVARLGCGRGARSLRGRVSRCAHVGGMDHVVGVQFIHVGRP